MALILPTPSSFFVFRWWEIWRDGTIQASMVFQCCCDPAALGYFSNLFQVPISVNASLHALNLSAVVHNEQWPSCQVMLHFRETEYTKETKWSHLFSRSGFLEHGVYEGNKHLCNTGKKRINFAHIEQKSAIMYYLYFYKTFFCCHKINIIVNGWENRSIRKYSINR